MDRRIIAKQYIDMDELSKPWESDNKLVTPMNDAKPKEPNEDLITIIKSVKEMYFKQDECEKPRVLRR